ncbi:MAG: DinB family protein [Bryobacteraceae bacterium]
MPRASLLLLIPALAFCQDALPERGRGLSELHATRKQFLDSIAGLSAAQWSFKPDAASWSIAECAEHLAVSEDVIFEIVTKKLPAGATAPPEKKLADDVVLKMTVDRSMRRKSPEAMAPSRRWASPEASVAHFRESRDRSLDYLRTTADPLRKHFAPHPAFGPLDGYQWLLVMSAHVARHVAQIEEIKANPRFPK